VVDPTYTAWIDACVNAIRARGMKVAMVHAASPAWSHLFGDWRAPPDDPNDFGWFCGWASAHFAGRVDAFEVLNEQNQTEFFTGTIAQYVGMLRACYIASKAASPTPVLLGGTVYTDPAWTEQVYELGGGPYFDAANAHPYNDGTAPEEPCWRDSLGRGHRLSCLGDIRAVLDGHGDFAKPIWVTEYGWTEPTTPPDLQAAYAVRAFAVLRASYPYVPVAFWYKTATWSSDPLDEGGFGLLRADLSPRPVYLALAGG
jgi:polysaccharide biosynthesis protein PslG